MRYVKSYKLTPPYRAELTYLRSSQADNAMMIPGVKRVGARSVEIQSDDYLVLCKFLRGLISLGREN